MIQLPPNINGWDCTDPDYFQYQKALSDTMFNMVQTFEMPDSTFIVAKGIIDLDDYTDEEINGYVTGYYNSLDDLKNQYGDNSNGIIAECIFESLQPMEYAYQFPAKDEEEAKKIVLELTAHKED